MTFLIYIMCVKIYCEVAGSYTDFKTFIGVGFTMWIIHTGFKCTHK